MKTKWTVDSLLEFEQKVAQEFKEGKIRCPVHLCGGNEQHLLDIFDIIEPQDSIVSTHRSHYHYLLKGGNPDELLAELKGERSGCCRGTGRSMHLYNSSLNFYTSAIVAGGCAIACGIGLGIKKRFPDISKKRPQVWCFVGDGAEDNGHFVEAVRFTSSRQLPVTFVIEDNDFAVDSTKKDRWHNYAQINGGNIIRYKYNRVFPHVGIGENVSF